MKSADYGKGVNYSKIMNLSVEESYVKNFIQFVSVMSDAESAVFFLWPEKSCSPIHLLNSYKTFDSFLLKKFDIYINCLQLNDQQTLFIGLGDSYLNIKSQKQNLCDKHLILLYLLTKFKSLKFALCFDKDSILKTSFQMVKKIFEDFKFLINQKDLKNLSESFIMILSHPNDQNIIQITKRQFQKSLEQKSFFKENKKIVSEVFLSLVKHKRFFQVSKSSNEAQLQKKRKTLEEMISHVKPLVFNSPNKIGLPLSDTLLKAFYSKSTQWKLFNNNQQDLSKTNTTTSTTKGGQKSQIKKFFEIWDSCFDNFIKYFVKKIQSNKKNSKVFTPQNKYLLSSLSQKYLILDQQNLKKKQFIIDNIHECLNNANLLAKIIKLLVSIVKDKGTVKAKNQVTYSHEKMKEFLSYFYKFGVLDAHTSQKAIYDNLMIFYEIYSHWSLIPDFQNQQDRFFQQNSLILIQLPDLPIVRKNLLENLVKSLVPRLQIVLKNFKSQKYCRIQQLKQPLIKIKQSLQEASLINFQSQRLLSVIQLFEKQIFQVEVKKLSDQPYQRVRLLFENLSNKSKQRLQEQDALTFLGETSLRYLKQYRVKNVQQKVILSIAKILQFKQKYFGQLCELYEQRFAQILNKKTQNQNFNDEQVLLFECYVDYLIKLGFLQMARQKAYEVSLFEQNIANSLLAKILLKTNPKRQMEFIKDNYKQTSENQLQNAISTLEQFFEISKPNPQSISEEKDLIDI